MSIADRVLSAMNFDREYSPEDIAAQCHIDQQDAGRYLHMLAKGGGSRVHPQRSIQKKP